MTSRRTSRSLLFIVPAFVLLSAAACKAPQAFGDRNSIIVRAEPGLWAEVDSTVMETLEVRVYTTRPERKFEITHVAPDESAWSNFRLWQQVVVMGTAEDELVRDLVDDGTAAPALTQTESVWARGQTVTVLLLPETGQAEAVRRLLPLLHATLDEQYREWVVERMYTSGVNDSLARALAEFGFTLRLPRVYIQARYDSLFRFGNPYQQGETDLLRSLLVTWHDGAREMSAEELRGWREEIDENRYSTPQDILEQGYRVSEIEVGGLEGIELRGVWQDRADFPAAGPFITRALACPAQDRTYLMDAWLFAPGTDKYPYVQQLEVLLDSFECVERESGTSGS